MQHHHLTLVGVTGLLMILSHSHAVGANCANSIPIEGTYACTGECVVTDAQGKQSIVEVTGETDTIAKYPGSQKNIYEVHIQGSNGFQETEIGLLDQHTLYAATSHVSDGKYPVMENYLFMTDRLCQVPSYSKIVLDPIAGQFKACTIQCKK